MLIKKSREARNVNTTNVDIPDGALGAYSVIFSTTSTIATHVQGFNVYSKLGYSAAKSTPVISSNICILNLRTLVINTFSCIVTPSCDYLSE